MRGNVIVIATVAAGALLAYPPAARSQPRASPRAQQITATRYSGLEQIDRGNVRRLRPLFSFRSGQRGAQGSAVVVVGSRLYLLTSFPHTLLALDLTHSPPSVSWKFTPAADAAAQGLACCERAEHGPVFGQGRLYFSTFDGHVLALDPDTGAVAWNVPVADPRRGETLASPPTLVGNRLIIGDAGADFGARGWIVALDTADGHELWRRYSSGPDQDVGITNAFVPARAADRRPGLGTSTWPAGGWQHSGGTVANPVLYDAELGLLLHNTGPPAPWNPQQRPGSNRWTSGLFARDPDSGAARWFTAVHSHNLYSWANATANVALDRPWNGTARKLLAHPDADGFLYMLDRGSGEILAADPLLPPGQARPASMASPSATRTPHAGVQVRRVCPAWVGAIGGDPSLSAATGLLYLPLSKLCMDIEARAASYLQGTPFLGANVRVYGATASSRGELVAWDPGLRRAVWRVAEKYPVASDVLTTAGGVVFYGTLDGILKAVDASSGALLWSVQLSAGIMGQPLTYQGPDGRQYLAVVAGGSGPYGLASEYWIDRRDATAARGLAQAIADLPAPEDPSGTLYVFGLP